MNHEQQFGSADATNAADRSLSSLSGDASVAVRKTRFFLDCGCGSREFGGWEALIAARSERCRCGEYPRTRKVRVGAATEHVCGSRCTHATGRSCNCACGGKNHGRLANAVH